MPTYSLCFWQMLLTSSGYETHKVTAEEKRRVKRHRDWENRGKKVCLSKCDDIHRESWQKHVRSSFKKFHSKTGIHGVDMLAPHFTWGFLLHLTVSQANRKTGGGIYIAGVPLSVQLLVYTHSGRVKAALTLNGKWQIWIMHTYNPTQINRRHGGLTKAKSWGCWRPESADYTPDALNNAPKCASLKAWNPWSIRADLSFAINIQSWLCFGGQNYTSVCWGALKQTLAKP